MTLSTDEKFQIAQTLITTVAEPLIKGILAMHPDPAKATTDLHDIIAAAIAGPGMLEAAEKADDAAADKAAADRFTDKAALETP